MKVFLLLFLQKKKFFFEKKNQKTFIRLGSYDLHRAVLVAARSFWLLGA